MAAKPDFDFGGGNSLNYWREYFRTANTDIFDIIEHAIMVAASDCSKEFRQRKGRIAEVLFSSRLTQCPGCDRVELAVSQNEGDIDGFKSKENEFNDYSINRDVNGEVDEDIENNTHSLPDCSFSFGDVEALNEEIDEEKEIVGEVFRIKDILQNSKDESDSVLYESLRRLQLMALNVDILKATEIGKTVNGIRRHSSKHISHLARSLIDGWKVIVDEWVKATQEIAGGTPDSLNPSTVDEEEGLPSPPLDEGAFMAPQSMELSQFFDCMDDDGNLLNGVDFNKNRGGRKPSLVKQDAQKTKEEPPKNTTPFMKDNNARPVKRQENLTKANRPQNMQSGPGRPIKVNGEVKTFNDSTTQQKPTKPVVQRNPASQTGVVRSSNEDAAQEKLEATKRKLQERYQQAENAKRQRTVQVMELHEVPKQGLVNKRTHGRFNNRQFANSRR